MNFAVQDASKLPGTRLLPGKFMAVEQVGLGFGVVESSRGKRRARVPTRLPAQKRAAAKARCLPWDMLCRLDARRLPEAIGADFHISVLSLRFSPSDADAKCGQDLKSCKSSLRKPSNPGWFCSLV